MVTIYNGNLGLVKDTREVRLDRGHARGRSSPTWRRRSTRPSVHLQVAHRPRRAQDPRAELRVRPADQREAHGEVRRQEGPALPVATARTRRRRCSRTNGPGLRDQRADPHGPRRPGGAAGAAREPGLQADARLAAAQRDGRRPSASRPRISPAGINWKADYVMVINAADTRSDLTGWVTIDNKSGAHLSRTPRSSWSRATSTARGTGAEARRMMEMAAKAASPAAAEPRLQVGGLLRVPPLHARRPHDHQGQPDQAARAAVRRRRAGRQALHLLRRRRLLPHASTACPSPTRRSASTSSSRTARRTGSGMPLPKGKVRVYKADASGSQQFIGEDWIDHTPKDEKVQDQDGRRLRRGRRAHPEGLEADRLEPLRGRVGDLAPQPQEGGRDRRGDRAHARATGR